MGFFGQIRERIGAVIGVVGVAVCFLAVGALMAFVISPQQALEWRKIEGLPDMAPDSYAAAAAGTELVLSGTLQNNTEGEYGFVAYEVYTWNVTPAQDTESEPDGDWVFSQRNIPALEINFQGTPLRTAASNDAQLSGSMQEFIEEGSGTLTDSYNGRDLPDGSLRTSGFANGELVTVYGQKASTGDLIPQRIFGGDRVQLVESIRQGARAAFTIGIGMMICSPFVVIFGTVAAVFGRRRRGL